MRERSWRLPVRIGLPVLAGEFVADWLWSKSLPDAAHRLPMRVVVMLAVILIWTAFRHWRSERTQTLR